MHRAGIKNFCKEIFYNKIWLKSKFSFLFKSKENNIIRFQNYFKQKLELLQAPRFRLDVGNVIFFMYSLNWL